MDELERRGDVEQRLRVPEQQKAAWEQAVVKHLDDAAARKTLFKGLAASGWHTAAIAMSLAVQIRPFGPHPLIGLGVDNLRWMLPVRPGDELHVEGEVISLTPSKTKPQGIVLVKWTAFNQKGEAVYAFTPIGIVPSRPPN